jgi:hypothetical protein
MNERIQELACQLGPIATIGNWGRVEWSDNVYPQLGDKLYAAIDLQKFAELIVKECTAALFDESERLSGLYSDEDNWDSAEEYEIRSNQCIDDIALIEKHFGVEE